ncbi:MAG: DUF4115 domain-containing protein [Proteobacteria bacterium]|nr:DUF4115 domain-containing protein [Pseudomonadota bacterium]MBU1686797.1 DUF4115 domain-containing protein [Pseudomonadota bacterium]
MNTERQQETLGHIFKSERTNQGKTLEEAAETTRIHIKQLQALEKDDFDSLPAEVFVRGFIRLYAKFLGMDQDKAIRHYFTQLNRSPNDTLQKPYHQQILTGEPLSRKPGNFMVGRTAAIMGIFILLILLFYFLGSFFMRENIQGTSPNTIQDTLSSNTIEHPPVENLSMDTLTNQAEVKPTESRLDQEAVITTTTVLHLNSKTNLDETTAQQLPDKHFQATSTPSSLIPTKLAPIPSAPREEISQSSKIPGPETIPTPGPAQTPSVEPDTSNNAIRTEPPVEISNLSSQPAAPSAPTTPNSPQSEAQSVSPIVEQQYPRSVVVRNAPSTQTGTVAPPYTLTLTFTGPCWIRIKLDDGDPQQTNFTTGDTITWKTDQSIALGIDHPDRARFTLNGNPFPVSKSSSSITEINIP